MNSRTPPKAPPAALPAALLVALGLLALAVVGVHDLLTAQGWATGTPWSERLVRRADGLTPSTAVVAVGVVVALVGLALVVVALVPARRTHRAADVEQDLWLSADALAALAGTAADRTAGVVSAQAEPAGRRRLRVDVVARETRDVVEPRVKQAVDEALSGLARAPYTVRTTEAVR